MPYLPFSALDRALYDQCVLASGCPVPYGLSDYLYATQIDRWGAWVWMDAQGGYRAVMPVPRSRKLAVVPYVAMPAFVQRLGVFASPGQEPSGQELIQAWRWVRQWHVRVHYSFWQDHPDLSLKPLRNLVLPLQEEYAALSGRYAGGLRDNLRKGRSLDVRPSHGGGITWRLFKENVAPRLSGWKEVHNRAWVRLYFQKSPHYRFLHLGAYAEGNTTPMPEAAASFCLFGNRIIYLMGASSPEGRDSGAMARIIDQVIRDHAGTAALLDFEGGNMAGTGKFFRSFGAGEELYWATV